MRGWFPHGSTHGFPWRFPVAGDGVLGDSGRALPMMATLDQEALMTTKQAIEKVLAGKRSGMRVPAIIEAGVPLATSLKGATPGQTFYSVLYAESKKDDGHSRSR
jgi:hypothetical protein